MLVMTQREQMPGLATDNPDILFPQMPQLDQFYYVTHSGTSAASTQLLADQ
jgi:hypothetical protein